MGTVNVCIKCFKEHTNNYTYGFCFLVSCCGLVLANFNLLIWSQFTITQTLLMPRNHSYPNNSEISWLVIWVMVSWMDGQHKNIMPAAPIGGGITNVKFMRFNHKQGISGSTFPNGRLSRVWANQSWDSAGCYWILLSSARAYLRHFTHQI